MTRTVLLGETARGNFLMCEDSGTHPFAIRSSRDHHGSETQVFFRLTAASLLVTLVAETGVLSAQDTGKIPMGAAACRPGSGRYGFGTGALQTNRRETAQDLPDNRRALQLLETPAPKAGPFQAHLGACSVAALKSCHFRL